VEDVFFSFSSNDFFSIQCSESEEQWNCWIFCSQSLR
jgi:hypothetical protein